MKCLFIVKEVLIDALFVFNRSIKKTYKNRHNKENGSWEVLIHSRLELSQTRTRRSMAYRMNESYLYSDEYFIIGENGVCPYNSHDCNGPLKPATQYRLVYSFIVENVT